MQHDRLHVVNAVPIKLLSDPYQSRYTMNAKQRQDLIGFNVNTDTSSKLSMPNQLAQSHIRGCQQGHKLQTINAKPMGMRSHMLGGQQGHKL